MEQQQIWSKYPVHKTGVLLKKQKSKSKKKSILRDFSIINMPILLLDS